MNGSTTIIDSPFLFFSAATSTGPALPYIATHSTAVGGTPAASAYVGEKLRLFCIGDVHSRWGVVQKIFDHEFGRRGGVALSTGDFIQPPILEGRRTIYFVHGNHDRAGTIQNMREARGKRFVTWNEARSRIAELCGPAFVPADKAAVLNPTGTDYSHLEPGVHTLPIADIIPTQEVVFVDSVADYIRVGSEGRALPAVRIIDGKIYVSIGHHRLIAELMRGKNEATVTVEGPNIDELEHSLKPVLHLRHPDLKSWHQVIWREGDKSGRIAQPGNWHGYNPIFAGEIIQLGGLRIAGIPGVFSKYFYDRPGKAPPKYFTRRQVEAMRSLERSIDILLMHDAPYGVGFKKDGVERGNRILMGIVEYLRPRLVLFGHHHQLFHGQFGETEVIGLDYPHRSYAVIEYDRGSDELSVALKSARAGVDSRRSKQQYQYDWESSIENAPHKVLFRRRIAVGREQDIVLFLRGEHKDRIQTEMADAILRKMPASIEDPDSKASLRAEFTLNSAIPSAAKYAFALESDPDMSLAERGELMDRIYREMCDGVVPDAVDDILLVFQECLKALGLVWSRGNTYDPQR